MYDFKFKFHEKMKNQTMHYITNVRLQFDHKRNPHGKHLLD